MGIMPGDIEYGDDCLSCWAAGKTPKYFKLFLSGISRGNDWVEADGQPPNGYWDLEQSDVSPCRWYSMHEGDPTVTWSPAAFTQQLLVQVLLLHTVFIARFQTGCKKWYFNNSIGPEHTHFYGGHAFLNVSGPVSGDGTPDKDSLTEIIESITPIIDPDPRMECFPMADELIVVRYAGKRDATNILIKFDTNP